ncbi:unnamed protein product [Parajaminaea phylloscopi]
MSLWWGSDPFAELVAKATSELLPAGQEDIALNLEICDHVRSKQVPAKQAMQTIKKRISDTNPNVVLLALGLTDICIKNGGDHFLAEVASREFMDNLASVLKKPAGVNHDVKSKALRLIQGWSQIAEAKPGQMEYISVIYRSLRADGFEFPAPEANAASSAAFVETLTAPEWVDGDVCMRCRTSFSTFNRKHHCRNCGNVFCQQCSSHTMSLPWYGVGQDVRICDGCYAKKAPPKVVPTPSGSKLQRSSTSSIVPSGRSAARSAQRSATLGSKPGSSRRSKREDDDLALAIKLSLQDSGGASTYASQGSAPSEPSTYRATRQPNGRMLEGTDADDDPDLAAAIAASLREYAPPQPSAPVRADELPDEHATIAAPTSAPSDEQTSSLPLPPSLDLPPKDVDAILTFAQTIHAQERQERHYGSTGPPSYQSQTLYDQATAARPKVARSLDEAGRRQGVLMSMHDKLTEAVRLYDRLLDAQMARPAIANGYAYARQQYQTPQQQYLPPASPDPYPRQHYAAHPQYSHPPQMGQYEGQAYPVQMSGPVAPSNVTHANSMYPSLPVSSASSMQPTAHPDGIPGYVSQQGSYAGGVAHDSTGHAHLSMIPSASQQSLATEQDSQYNVATAGHQAYGYAPHLQQLPQGPPYYAGPVAQTNEGTYSLPPQQPSGGWQPEPYPVGVAHETGQAPVQYPYQHSSQPAGYSTNADPSAVPTSPGLQAPAALNQFEKLMSPGQSVTAPQSINTGAENHDATEDRHPESRAGVGAHGKTAGSTSPAESWTNNGSYRAPSLSSVASPTASVAPSAPAPAPAFPVVPTSTFAGSQSQNEPSWIGKASHTQQPEAPALIEL